MSAGVSQSREILRQHSRSFSLAVACLPRAARSDASVVYGWCRRADDAIDESSGAEQEEALARLQDELSVVYSPVAPRDELLRAFQDVVQRRDIPHEYPAELLAGMAMDASGQRYGSLDQLLLYCHRVASTVGLMMCHVLQARHPSALRHAAHLGLAMQLTNICRDVREDWARGRLYLPHDVLQRHAAAHEILEERAGPLVTFPSNQACQGAVRELLGIAERYYASGDCGLRYLPWRAALAVNLARRVYAAIGTEIARTGHDVMAPRAVVPQGRKARLAAAAVASTLADRFRWPRSLEALPLHTVQYGFDLDVL